MMFISTRSLAAALVVTILLPTAWPEAAGAQNPPPPARSAAAVPPSDDERAPKPARPVSDDTAEVLAAIKAMGPGVGRAADPQSQALLGQLAELMESRDDADSQAAAAVLREQLGGAARAVPARPSGRTPE